MKHFFRNLALWNRSRCGLKGLMHLDRLNRQELSALSELSRQEANIDNLIKTSFAALKKEIADEFQNQLSEAKQNQEELARSIQTLKDAVAKKSKLSELDERIQVVSSALDSLSAKLQSVESNQKLILLDLVMNHADQVLSQEDNDSRSNAKGFASREDALSTRKN